MEDIKTSGIVDRGAGIEGLSDKGMEAARLMIKKYTHDLMNLDDVKAETYLATSLSGQVSDIAQGIRMTEDTPAIENSQGNVITITDSETSYASIPVKASTDCETWPGVITPSDTIDDLSNIFAIFYFYYVFWKTILSNMAPAPPPESATKSSI